MNNELKEKFKNEFAKVWSNSKKMQEYCLKELSNGAELENGLLIEFNKPRIEKRFCFGHGQNGITTNEETINACNMAQHARTSENYFIDENMKGFKELEKILNADRVYLNRYNKHGYISIDAISDELPYQEWLRPQFFELTKKDIENLKNVLKEEKEKFLKRLNTYLKKYGLTKVESWTYLID